MTSLLAAWPFGNLDIHQFICPVTNHLESRKSFAGRCARQWDHGTGNGGLRHLYGTNYDDEYHRIMITLLTSGKYFVHIIDTIWRLGPGACNDSDNELFSRTSSSKYKIWNIWSHTISTRLQLLLLNGKKTSRAAIASGKQQTHMGVTCTRNPHTSGADILINSAMWRHSYLGSWR